MAAIAPAGTAMSDTVEQALQRELNPGERLLWSGSPRQGLQLRGSDIFLIPFSLMWGGFAFFWEYTVVASQKAPFFFMLWGVPFVLVGIYFIIGRFFVDSYQRSRTCYGVTDERALILSGVLTREMKSLSLRNLEGMSMTERSDGSGSILFGSINPINAMWYGTAWPGMTRRLVPAFELIDDVRKVYDLIKQAQRSKS
jgi:hypothetical protein